MKTLNLPKVFSTKLAILSAAVWTAFLLLTASASAIPIAPPGYELSGRTDFWSITDMASRPYASAYFQIQMEEASYESGFGLYTVDNILQPSGVVSRFALFERDAEKGDGSTLTFWNDAGNWRITDQFNVSAPETSTWTPFDPIFGFYYDVDAGDDGSIDYTFYTASNLNTRDAGIEHIYTAYDASSNSARIYLEDLLSENADWDWQDMTVSAKGVQTAPVPEPASMVLVGLGLVLFSFVTRRGMGFKH